MIWGRALPGGRSQLDELREREMDNHYSEEQLDMSSKPDPESEGFQGEREGYSDLILVDLLHLDWKHFFKRYKIDFFGFALFFALMVLVMVGTYLLKNIGS
jgi:hypothetical protein